MIRKIILGICVFLLPVLLFIKAVQAYNYFSLKQTVQKMEQSQNEWLDKNKKLTTMIAILCSPQRIEKIAAKRLHLEKADPRLVFKLFFERNER